MWDRKLAGRWNRRYLNRDNVNKQKRDRERERERERVCVYVLQGAYRREEDQYWRKTARTKCSLIFKYFSNISRENTRLIKIWQKQRLPYVKILLFIVRRTQQCGAKLSYATMCCVQRTVNNKLLYWHNGMEYPQFPWRLKYICDDNPLISSLNEKCFRHKL